MLPFVSVTSASCTSTRVNEMGGRREGCVPILPCIPQQADALDDADQVTTFSPDIRGPVPRHGHQQGKNKP